MGIVHKAEIDPLRKAACRLRSRAHFTRHLLLSSNELSPFASARALFESVTSNASGSINKTARYMYLFIVCLLLR